MRKKRSTIISVFCVLSAIFGFSQISKAQVPLPSYGFLETVDYKNQPVADASVRYLNIKYFFEEPQIERGSLIEKTNQKGLLEKGIRVDYNDFGTAFSIDKAGFYPFINYFGLFGSLNDRRNNRDEPLKIELLVIPKNKAERKIIGREQEKREFFGAARRGDAVLVRKFIKSGLSPNLTTADLRGVPVENDEPVILYAVKSGSGAAVKEFLSAGVKVNKTDEPVKSILTRYLNAYPSRKKIPEENEAQIISEYEAGAVSLIEAGANVNPSEKGSVTPLMLAAQKFYAQITRKLLKKGAFVDAQDSVGRTPLIYLIAYKKPPQRLEIADLLIKAGANVNLLTNETPYSKYSPDSCRTALAVAVEGYDVEMVKLLLTSGADVNLTCKDGLTPLNYARELSPYIAAKEKKEIIEMLEAAGAK